VSDIYNLIKCTPASIVWGHKILIFRDGIVLSNYFGIVYLLNYQMIAHCSVNVQFCFICLNYTSIVGTIVLLRVFPQKNENTLWYHNKDLNGVKAATYKGTQPYFGHKP
jgi:hypothetical protein